MKTNLVNSATKAFKKTAFKVKKHSPAILLTAGIVGVVTGGVMACKATLKVNEVLEPAKEQIDNIHTVIEDETKKDEYTEEDKNKALVLTYAKTGIELGKLYGPSIAVSAVSIVSILASYRILNNRHVALTSAYAILNNSFKGYRNRVIERFGRDVDFELKNNVVTKAIEETITDEKGKEKKVTNVKRVVNGHECSEYAKFFDEYSTEWQKDPEYNLAFLKAQQDYANNKLVANGYLFLNDVYDSLGLPRTKAGQIVGWIYDPKDESLDNFVDFGIYNIDRESNRLFVNGYEQSILLDFNVTGNIWDLM